MNGLARRVARGLAAVAAITALAVPAGARPVDRIAVAVADAAHRSADNVKLDASRKPADILHFFQVRRGMKVADLFGSNHYWSELLSPVVGPAGTVTVWEPTQFLDDKSTAEFAAFAATHPNVHLITSPFEAPVLPQAAYDFMLINLNYHDVYWTSEKYGVVKMDPAAWLKTVAASVRRGGIVGVVDHVGPAADATRDTRAIVDQEHRIDPAIVKADFERAGFRLVGSSNLLANPADDHKLLVFDPAIRGKTDRFVYRFRKVR